MRKALKIGVAMVATLAPVAAFATDPTYTSQIGTALSAVNMGTLTTDVGTFAGLGFSLLLTTMGVFFVAHLLRRFLK